MCDTVVVAPPGGPVWFGKNSDREPGEAQAVEHVPARDHAPGASLQCTYAAVPQVARTHELVLSRPFWMWGAEMGMNERGVAIGNEAVFTRVKTPEGELLGMDLLRLALERAGGALEALEVICELLAAHGQGGVAGYRKKSMRYHNSFLIADPREAWVLETAGPYWAAERVSGVRTLSNVLSIGERMDRVHPGAADFARQRGWLPKGRTFDFAAAFADPLIKPLTGGDQRRACTRRRLEASAAGAATLREALCDHGGRPVTDGLVMHMPCAHASLWPTRTSGQTTGSMVCRLGPDSPAAWLTGTSSPCLSVFKPVRLGEGLVSTGPSPQGGYDGESLFWRHERLHRRALADLEAARAVVEEDRRRLEDRALAALAPSASECSALWEEHRQALPAWTERLRLAPRGGPLFRWYWRRQSALDRVPA